MKISNICFATLFSLGGIFFCTSGLNAEPFRNSEGGNIYGNSDYNIYADPDYNINADPTYNICADPNYYINGCE